MAERLTPEQWEAQERKKRIDEYERQRAERNAKRLEWIRERKAAGTYPAACLACEQDFEADPDRAQPCWDDDPHLNPYCTRGF